MTTLPMRLIALLALSLAAGLLLGGCSTAGKFDNLIVRSLQGDRAFAASTYGPFGLTSELRAEDAAELQRTAEAARQAEQLMLIMRLQAAQPPKGP